jgi:hypothetical protein
VVGPVVDAQAAGRVAVDAQVAGRVAAAGPVVIDAAVAVAAAVTVVAVAAVTAAAVAAVVDEDRPAVAIDATNVDGSAILNQSPDESPDSSGFSKLAHKPQGNTSPCSLMAVTDSAL